MSHVTHMNVPGLGAGSSSEEAFILWLLIQHIARLCAVFGFTAREEVKARLAVRRCADHGIYLKGLCAMHTLASRSLHISRPRHPSPLSRSSCCRCTLLSATPPLAAVRIYTARHAQMWLFAVRHTQRTRPSSCALQGVANVQTAKSLEKLQRVAVQVKRGTASLPHVALPHVHKVSPGCDISITHASLSHTPLCHTHTHLASGLQAQTGRIWERLGAGARDMT